MANIFISHERRGLCRPEEISHWFMLLGSMSIRIDREASTYEGAVNCVRIARQFKLSAYDAQYLELALRCHCPLASFDARLVAAAGAAGVGLGL